MERRWFRLTEIDAAQRYAQRLRGRLAQPVRVTRGPRQVVVDVVQDERRAQVPRTPDRRAR